MSLFGTSGIRGPVGETVTADLALRVGRAVVAEADATTVVVGRDVRDSGRVLADALSAGVRECGADVVRLGVASTPTVARSVGWRDADVGVSVTASHNPPTDNGLKLWAPSGRGYGEERTAAVERLLSGEGVTPAGWDGHGAERSWAGAAERHVSCLADDFEPLSGLSVVVDLGNGAGRVTVDALYELGATVHTLDAQPDGRFPARESEPNAETLGALRATVPAVGADLGVAHDGDADRMVAVDGTGRFVPKDDLLALFARDAVSPGESVAVPVDTSQLVADVVGAAGGEVVYTPVGDTYVAAQAARPGFAFGGEPSGAWIWPGSALCPDGHYAACRLASLVAREGSLSALADFDDYDYATERANVEVERKAAVMEAVEQEADGRYEADRVSDVDGVRVSAADGWFLVRASGTQPLVRLTAEADDADRADDLLDEAHDLLDEGLE